jgi:antitoxin ParD1/3/4
MPTRNVVLTARNEALIDALVTSGRYQNASEVLREGLRLVEQREAEEAAKLKALRDAAQVGITAIERGESMRFETIDELNAHLDAVVAAAIADGRRG